MEKNWLILYAVLTAKTYDEFDFAYSMLKSGKKGKRKSSVDLWKVINGQMNDLYSERNKRLYERKKLLAKKARSNNVKI